jgi:type II secretory pathway component PulM
MLQTAVPSQNHVEELVSREELHDQEQLVGGLEYVHELDDVGVVQTAHDVHFASYASWIESLAQAQRTQVDDLQGV